MALTSFQLRRSDDVGSYVQGEGVLDSAIRSDRYVLAVESAGSTSTFSADVFNVVASTVIDSSRPGGSYTRYTTTLDLAWSLSTKLVAAPVTTAPIELWIIGNQNGEPVTVEDGVQVFSCNSTTFVDAIQHTSSTLRLGSWLYYGFFIKYSNGSTEWFERVAVLYVQIPKQYESSAALWQRIPEYYRYLDATAGNNNLYDFLKLFGWELDRMRSLIDSLSIINDPLLAITPALDLIAQQLGVPNTSTEIGTSKLRNVLLNILELRKIKGTAKGVTAYISALTGCVSEFDSTTNTFKVFSQRVNLLSDPKFRQQALTYYIGSPATVDRVPFSLRNATDGSALRNPNSNDDALRAYSSNPLALVDLVEYTTTSTANAAASIGWGVYTYGNNYSAGASVPVIVRTTKGISITIPAEANGPQTVVVYGRKPFIYKNDIVYYSSFNCTMASASFSNFRFVTNDRIITQLEYNPPDYYASALYYDSWNTATANADNLFVRNADSYYNTTNPGLATSGRFAVQHPVPVDPNNVEDIVLPVLVFNAVAGSVITISEWLVEADSIGTYFDGDKVFGGFIREANQLSVVGLSDYRWGPNGGNTNQDFSYYTLDYGRVTVAVKRVVEEHLLPVTMIGNYTIAWNKLPGD